MRVYIYVNYNNMSLPITLQPLITLPLQHKSSQHPAPLHLQIKFPQDQPSPLIAMIAISKQHLSLIAQLQLQQQHQQQHVIVYYSTHTIQIAHSNYRVVYVPPSKAYPQIYGCMGEVFRELADIVISDINSAGVHKLKQKQHIDNQHYLLSADRVIYQVAIKQSSFQLARTMQLPLLHHIAQSHIKQCSNKVADVLKSTKVADVLKSTKATDVLKLMEIVSKYANDWMWVLSQKSWALLGCFSLQHYRCMSELIKYEDYNLMIKQGKMLSNTQIQIIQQHLLTLMPNTNIAVIESVVGTIVNEINQQNKHLVFGLVQSIQTQIINSNISTLAQLENRQQHTIQRLSDYNIPPQIIQTILLPKSIEIHQHIIHSKDTIIAQLSSDISNLQQTITRKDNNIQQLNNNIQMQREQLKQYHQIDNIKRQLQQMLQTQSLRNQQLTLQLTSSHLLERKSLQAKVQLQHTIMQVKYQKDGLLQCLQELTKQNLCLLSQKQQRQTMIKQLKESLQQAAQIQMRALRSIQNQAQIRTRLYRYQKYVSELKLSIKSFKKLQSEKFNYILHKNHQQYQHLQNKYNQTLSALKQEQKQNKMLNQHLQRERIRLNYFQKLLITNYQHQPIPECSQQNSQTDRDLPTVLVD